MREAQKEKELAEKEARPRGGFGDREGRAPRGGFGDREGRSERPRSGPGDRPRSGPRDRDDKPRGGFGRSDKPRGPRPPRGDR